MLAYFHMNPNVSRWKDTSFLAKLALSSIYVVSDTFQVVNLQLVFLKLHLWANVLTCLDFLPLLWHISWSRSFETWKQWILPSIIPAECDLLRAFTWMYGLTDLDFVWKIWIGSFLLVKNSPLAVKGLDFWPTVARAQDKSHLNHCFCTVSVSDSKAETKASLWRIPPVDDTEPPHPDSPAMSPAGGHTRSLQLLCNLDNSQENMKRFVGKLVNSSCLEGTKKE